jgi:ABC-2 type transport system ATP-binding protein
VVPQEMAFYEELSAKENLLFWEKLHGVDRKTLEKRIQYYLKKTGLLGRENDPLKKYSGGMKRRINLILGLIHQPKLLLLDEPTTGIDIQTKLNIYNIIKEASIISLQEGKNGQLVFTLVFLFLAVKFFKFKKA